MKSRMIALLMSVLGVQATYASLEKSISIFTEEESSAMMQAVAEEVIALVRVKPEAKIVLPYGDSSDNFYRSIVSLFKQDEKIDFSKATWLYPGEYVGYNASHPLSVTYFIDTYFTQPLRLHNQDRAPYIARMGTNGEGDFRDSGIDLSVIDLGPAYPSPIGENGFELVGGRVGFCDSGPRYPITFDTKKLSDHAKSGFNYKIKSLKKMQEEGLFTGISLTPPDSVTAFGLRDLWESHKLVFIAQGEDKAHIMRQVQIGKDNEKFPAAYFVNHPRAKWFVDENAAAQLGYFPWQVRYTGIGSQHNFNMSLCSLAEKLPAEKITAQKSAENGVLSMDEIFESRRLVDYQLELLKHMGNITLPEGKRILIISPHPDDDVISMGGAMQELLARNNLVQVLYAVAGSNAVRESLPAYMALAKGLANPDPNEIKAVVREHEAESAVKLFGMDRTYMTFFRAEYYDRRGIPGVSPISRRDLDRMVEPLTRLQPDYIYFAGENDPHGAHGLSTQLVAEALKRIGNKNIQLRGYRGAYGEWPLYDPSRLSIVPLNQGQFDLKLQAIKAHVSQLNPVYPSADTREFWERARDRNAMTAQRIKNLVSVEFPAAEVFKTFTYDQFVKLYGARQ
jgi:6-phosphogluconolactonase/glucosamine-6-phosphate isomerase/deaminase/LmbE family N-acetylglucosaminyl deacetylase